MAKRYLNVSYADRDLAKKLGARWDPSVKRWYCPAGSALETIFAWRKEAQVKEERKNAPVIAKRAPKVALNQNFELPLAS
ncbi:hypothetical protein DES40_2098 [Litorimonas taeanensis]|uniref:DUF5710 domain-containing protein n=1 Tax=Litorimonas taeanensis TaxID=568099 RepID=A0A420WE49_9PROT|nr:DUF5710 domain-containing protein [Litorimonas taeanensis]RKQ69299.1 hypothetical protein DES40_2098 [Litorimonas taeanensis]